MLLGQSSLSLDVSLYGLYLALDHNYLWTHLKQERRCRTPGTLHHDKATARFKNANITTCDSCES
jgi:hypothetical protein